MLGIARQEGEVGTKDTLSPHSSDAFSRGQHLAIPLRSIHSFIHHSFYSEPLQHYLRKS